MCKKFYSAAIALVAMAAFAAFVGVLSADAETQASAGDIIKGETHSTVYYLGEDGKRYVFPNGNTYFSWFDDFDHVKQISDEELMSYPLAGNVRYKPGSVLVKIQTNPRVYAVGENGRLRWVKTEEVARSLYGKHWNKLVDDVPDSFFVNYEESDPIEEETDFSPTEVENDTPAIGYNLGLKARNKLQNKIQKAQERRCQRWQKVTNRLQKRMARLGMELPEDIGEEYLNECVGGGLGERNNNGNQNGTASGTEMVTICKVPHGNAGAAHTITVASPAVRAHLMTGSYLGACDGDDEADEEGGDEEEGEGDEEDTTAPAISAVEALTGTTTATVSWQTDEAATSLLTYAAESLDEASTTDSMSSDDYVADHSFDLIGLASSTTYYFMVESVDEAGNKATSSEEMFTTL